MPSVYVSPSAQEHNVGSKNYGTEEQVMNRIADVVCNLLTYNKVSWKRNKPEMDLKQIIADSNRCRCDIHVAIHSNSGGGSARGCEVFAWMGDTKTSSMKLAEELYNRVAALTPTTDRGIKDGKRTLGEIKDTKSTAALIEVAFHDNSEDALWILSNIYALGRAIAQAICAYFNVLFNKPSAVVKPKDEILVYGTKTEEFGPYLFEQYAKNKCNQLKAAGFKDIYYVKPDGTKVPIK